MSRSLVPALLLLSAAGCPAPPPPECGEFDQVYAYVDADGDGYGGDEAVGWVCAVGDGESADSSDCEDGNEKVHPNSEEECDDLDNDCDGRVDDGLAFVPWYPDEDGDGFGVTADAVIACVSPSQSHIRTGNDCDDENTSVNPAIVEICNSGVDDDCDGVADDDDLGVDPTTMTRIWLDGDGDGFGDPATFADFCIIPGGLSGVVNGDDCDDTRATTNPDAPEVCDRRDDDCDTLTDDDDPDIVPASQLSYHADTDGDGFGDPAVFTLTCERNDSLGVLDDSDCDDTDPGANLVYDWAADVDGDTIGDGVVLQVSCYDQGPGLVIQEAAVDCAPTDPDISPLADEICDDGLDDDCDTRTDCSDSDCTLAPSCCTDVDWAPAALPAQIDGDTTLAVNNVAPSCGGNNGRDVRFWFTPPTTGLATFSTVGGAAFDTVIHVYTRCSGSQLACSDNALATTQSSVTVPVATGVPILVVVDGDNAGQFGPFTLFVD